MQLNLPPQFSLLDFSELQNLECKFNCKFELKLYFHNK